LTKKRRRVTIRHKIMRAIERDPATAEEISHTTGEERKRVVSNLGPMCKEKLVDRILGLEGLVEYKLTDKGVDYLDRNSVTSPVCEVAQVATAETTCSDCSKVARELVRSEKESSLLENRLNTLRNEHDAVVAQLSQKDGVIASLTEQIEQERGRLVEWQNNARYESSRAEEATRRYDELLSSIKGKLPSYETLELLVNDTCAALERAGMGGHDGPGEAIGMLAAERDRLNNSLAETIRVESPVCYVVRDGKSIVHAGKSESTAQARARSISKRAGKTVRVFAIFNAGKAIPGSVWNSEQGSMARVVGKS